MSATKTAPMVSGPRSPMTAQSLLLTRVQPALSGLMDGSLSTLAPIFAVALATHRPLTAFFTGVATALGAGVSMAFSEGLSDTGDLTGRGSPVRRGTTSSPSVIFSVSRRLWVSMRAATTSVPRSRRRWASASIA